MGILRGAGMGKESMPRSGIGHLPVKQGEAGTLGTRPIAIPRCGPWDWMRTMSPLTFDFNKLELTLEVEERKLTLSGNV